MPSKILQRIQKVVHEEQRNWLTLVVGKTGSGKSYASARLCQLLDKNFGVDRVCFTPKSFMDLVKTDLPPGSCILADEIGSWLPAREFMSQANRLLSIVLQTFRFKRFIIFWSTPISKFVDVNLRTLADSLIETQNIDRKRQIVITKYKYVTVNPVTGKEMFKFPRIPRPRDSPLTIMKYNIGKPSPEFVKLYEKKKKKRMNPLYSDIADKFAQLEQYNKPKVSKKDTILKLLNGGVKEGMIADSLGTSLEYVRVVKSNNKPKD